jgi:nucleoside-diphosphate-sugar epimerase
MMENPSHFFLKKRVLITGASGFIGRHLIQQLHEYGAQISTISRNRSDFPQKIEQYAINITNTRAIHDCIQNSQPDYIFHLAAYKKRDAGIQAFYSSVETNLIGSLNVFSAAKDVHSIQSIVTVGTAEEYGNNKPPFNEQLRECPVTPYSFSKLCVSHMGELFFHLYNLPVIIVRPTIAYGPGQGMDMFLPSLISSLLDNKPFDMTFGKQTRDFVYVSDLVEALILASRNTNAQGQIINIGSGVSIRLADVAEKIEKMLNKKGLVNLGGKPYRKNEVMDYHVDLTKAQHLLGWTPKISLEEGLTNTIAHYKDVIKV